MFDPGDCTGRLRGCPFLGAFSFGRRMLPEAGALFWLIDGLEYHFPRERCKRIIYAVRLANDRCFSAARLVRVSRQNPTA